MQTINGIITTETEYFVNGLSKGDDDYLAMEEELMDAVRKRVQQANWCVSKNEPKLRMPRYLNSWQIAAILAATMHLRAVRDEKGKPRVEIYLGRGTWVDASGRICKAAMRLHNAISKSALREVEDHIIRMDPRVSVRVDEDCERTERTAANSQEFAEDLKAWHDELRADGLRPVRMGGAPW